jgi:hypothetical protein
MKKERGDAVFPKSETMPENPWVRRPVLLPE